MLSHATRKLHRNRDRRRHGLVGLVPVLLALALASSACSSNANPGTVKDPPNAKVTDLRSVSDLQARFEEDSDKVRLILLISPT